MPNSIPVVTSFKPGQSGNPNGRPPKEWTMTGLYKEALDEENESGVPRKKIVAKKLVQLAERGDVVAIKELGNRVDGMPVQKNIFSGDEDSPIVIEVNTTLNKIYGSTDTKSSGEVRTDST